MDELTIAELSLRCKEESARYLRHEPHNDRFCFELFRRAVVQRDDVAWAAIYDHYSGMVRRWVGNLPDAQDDGVTGAFERFWRAITPAKFERFSSLPAILQYLKLCVHTAELDRRRAARAVTPEQRLAEGQDFPARDNPQEAAIQTVDSRPFWAMVQQILDDSRERRVIYLSYVLGMPPRVICERYATVFPDIQEVYRLKRNALERLKRVPELQMSL